MNHLGNTHTIEQPINQRLLSRLTRSLRAAWNAWPNVHGRWHREAMERKALTELRAMDDRQLADLGVSRSNLYGLSKGLCCAPEVRR
jgi:uncharacterized protein YjiS (DUF1127 family)